MALARAEDAFENLIFTARSWGKNVAISWPDGGGGPAWNPCIHRSRCSHESGCFSVIRKTRFFSKDWSGCCCAPFTEGPAGAVLLGPALFSGWSVWWLASLLAPSTHAGHGGLGPPPALQRILGRCPLVRGVLSRGPSPVSPSRGQGGGKRVGTEQGPGQGEVLACVPAA